MATYVDGLYKGTARGIGGQLNVEVIIEGGVFVDLRFSRLKETSGIGLDAAPLLAQSIVAAGTTDGVDGIAGCTVTSNAILAAAKMAFEAASGQMAYEEYLDELEAAEEKKAKAASSAKDK